MASEPGVPHLLLTALGTRAIETRYRLGGEETTASLAPAALMRLLPPEKRPEEILVLVTPKARAETLPVLESELEVPPRPVDIPPGRDATEIQEILRTVCREVPAGTRLTMDLTQGYRSLPLLFHAAGLFLSSLRDVALEGAWYGSLEGRGEDGVAPFLDLAPILSLPRWFLALKELRTTGRPRWLTQALDATLATLRDELGKGPQRAALSSLERLRKHLQELGFARDAHLLLESGWAARLVCESVESGGVEPLAASLPLSEEVLREVSAACESFEFPSGLPCKTWKKSVGLDSDELERQAKLICRYREAGELTRALEALREWMVSWTLVRLGRTEGWLGGEVRRVAERRLGFLEAVSRKRGAAGLSDEAREVGVLWGDITQRRNATAHCGMCVPPVVEQREALEAILERWDSLRVREVDLSLGVGEPAGVLLVSPVGMRPGSLYSALHTARPSHALVFASEEARAGAYEAAERYRAETGAALELDLRCFEDPFAGYEELARVRDDLDLVPLLLRFERVVVNLTGGTTLLGLAAQSVVELCRANALPVARCALVDRRSSQEQEQEQEQEPWVVGEAIELDRRRAPGTP